MRILQLHCDYIEYTPVKKEIRSAEDIPDASPVRHEDIVAVFVTAEKGDDAQVAAEAARQIAESASKVGCMRVLIYPYAHLSGELAGPDSAKAALDALAAEAGRAGLEVHRSPFGWTKSYGLQVKGHPLAESSKRITAGGKKADGASEALKSESALKSRWCVMTPDGQLHEAAGYDFGRGSKLGALAKYESAKSRKADEPPPHVALMKKMAIADYEPASDHGNMRFYPNGRLIKSLIERHVTERVKEYGGYEVETPIMYDSNHPSMKSYFNRFPARQYSIDSEGKELFLRFAACFGQFLMANDFQMSYRSLPYRLYELTRYSFRREQSGELVGLRRLRAFTMPDCHAFCKDMPQAIEELGRRFELSKRVITELGMGADDYEMAVRMTEEFYAEHGEAVRAMVAGHGRPVLVEMWSERFFYFVLKWEFNYVDGSGKASALSTDQIDVENGSRYGIDFVDESNQKKNPIILHNSPSGAVERVIYALLEKAAAGSRRGTKPSLPLWLAPTQARVIPLAEEFDAAAAKIAARLADDRVRADIDDRSESIGKRIRDAEKDWVRYILVIGKKEAESGALSVRDRQAGQTREMQYEQLVAEAQEQTDGMPYSGLNMPLRLSQRPQIMV